MADNRFAAADRPDDAQAELPGERPVSGLAVAAAFLGCVAALALVSPVFWVIPLVGVAVAVAAIRDVSRVGMAKAGGLAAVAGLALSLGFGAQAVAAAGMARWLVAARAESAAHYWIDAVCGDRAADARSMCGPDAADRIEAAVACCGDGTPTVRCLGAGETPGTWLVQISHGSCTLDLAVEPSVSTTGGRPVERWLVTSVARRPADGVD
jgi:hypothetical protein